MPVQNRGDGIEIALGREDHAARPHHRLRNHRGNGFRPFAFDHRIEIFRQPGGELFLRLARFGTVIVMRTIGVQREIERQVEAFVIAGQAGQTGAGQGHAVIGLVARKDFPLLSLAAGVGGIPVEFDLGIVGLRTGIGEEDAAHRERHHLFQFFRQRNRRFMTFAGEDVPGRQFAHLFGSGFGQRILAPAQCRAPQAGHRLDIILAALVIEAHALTAIENQRPGFAQLHQIGVGVQHRVDIAHLGIAEGHENLRFLSIGHFLPSTRFTQGASGHGSSPQCPFAHGCGFRHRQHREKRHHHGRGHVIGRGRRQMQPFGQKRDVELRGAAENRDG